MIKSASQFSGIGAFECALENLKLEHENVMAVEFCKYARLSFLANFKEPKHYFKDSYDADYENVEQTDIFLSSPPCQAFSLAGKRLGELDKRGILFYETYRFISVNQPKVFIIENVKGLLSAEKGTIFQNWIELLGRSVNGHEKMFIHEDSLEYNLHYTVLNSKNFGVPQNRERVFIVGIRKDLPNNFRFPIGWKLDKRLRDVLETEVDEKYYLSDKCVSRLTNNNDGYHSDIKNENDIASTVLASDYKLARGMNILKVKEPFCVAMRGRNPLNPSDRTTGTNLEQTLEVNSQGITNTISTVQKDNLIVEPKIHQKSRGFNKGGLHDICPPITSNSFEQNNVLVEPQLKQIAQIDGFESEGRIYDSNGLARTIKDGGGGGSKTGWYKVDEDKITLIEHRGHKNKDAKIIDTEIVPTLRAESHGHETKLFSGSRIRRLKPLECFRLQGFSDEFFYKCKEVNSDTQLYRQSGNTITVSVIQAIINNLKHLLK